MTQIRLCHASDLHFCERFLPFVEKAFTSFVDGAIEGKFDAAVISGDSFDAQIHAHDPALHVYLRELKRLADHMPVLVLAGTQSHDRPGSLEVLRTLAGKFPVYVADKIEQVALTEAGWEESGDYRFGPLNEVNWTGTPLLIVSCLPSIHKGTVKAMAGEDATPASLVEDVCKGWAETNLAARAAGIPTILVTHGTVNGSVTESRYAMISPDHEFSPGVLFSAQASAVMVGHIHAHNQWEHEGRRIAYPGSITRLIHGHDQPTYWLDWTVGAETSEFSCVETPSRELISIEFDGPPDLEKLKTVQCAGAYVRVRWSVDEEHKTSIDPAAIREILKDAADVKLEGRVNPIQRTRAEGLTRTESLADKLDIWGKVTETDTAALQDRLADLQIHDSEKLVAMYASKQEVKQEEAA